MKAFFLILECFHCEIRKLDTALILGCGRDFCFCSGLYQDVLGQGSWSIWEKMVGKVPKLGKISIKLIEESIN